MLTFEIRGMEERLWYRRAPRHLVMAFKSVSLGLGEEL
jgi:hypothetical protein